MLYKHEIERYFQKRIELLIHQVNYTPVGLDDLYIVIKRKIESLKNRGAKIIKSNATIKINRKFEAFEKATIDYVVYFQHFIQHGKKMYMEEEQQQRQAVFYKGELVSDVWLPHNMDDNHEVLEWEIHEEELRVKEYNRVEAVKYAETYWNSYNQKYPRFENNCTNFISQCLYAGGATMQGYPKKNRGWWVINNEWSHSWTMANGLYWYLKGSKHGLRGEEIQNPKDLLLGDIICYDFKGVGQINHNTMVTDKDENGMPLVNANTFNSRHRFWNYEDSTAYTPDIKYHFFRIKV